MKKKTVSLLLTALLIAVIVPSAAFAAEEHNIMLTSQQPGTVIQDNDITWIKEESYDIERSKSESAWYGLDNTNGVFPEGSRLIINWVDENTVPEEAGRYKLNVDTIVDLKVKNTDTFSFWGVVDSGNNSVNPENPVTLYVQIPDDWDSSDVQAYFINEGEDERVMAERANNIVSPDGSNNFVKLTVNHLDAPLLVAEKASFSASVWTHFQPGITIGIVLIIGIAAIILIRKKNESK